MNRHGKIWLILAVSLVILAGIFLRFISLSEQSYWMDEGYTVNAIDSGIRNGWVGGAAILDSQEIYFCPIYCLPTAWLAQFEHATPASYRFFAAVFGLIFIGVSAWISWIFFKNKPATVLTIFFTSFSYWQITWSRQARWYTMLEVFFWLALGLFYLGLKETRKKYQLAYAVGSILATIVAIATHKLAYLLPVVMLIWFVIDKKPKIKQLAMAAGIMFAVLAFIELGLNLPFIANAIQRIDVHYTLPYYLNFYLRNYWPFLLLTVYGYFGSREERKKRIGMLAVPFLLYLFFLSFFTNIVHYRYLFHTTAVFFVIGAMVIVDTVQTIRQTWKKVLFLVSVFVIFFLSGEGILLSKDFYTLESDSTTFTRPHFAYTPQPDFTAAYQFIAEHQTDHDIVISSHPHFNKIFLNEAGYWLKYNYLGMDDTVTKISNDKEYYVGATVIDDLPELQRIMSTEHGFVVFDYMAMDGRIPKETIGYVQKNATLEFERTTNSFSRVWVYRF